MFYSTFFIFIRIFSHTHKHAYTQTRIHTQRDTHPKTDRDTPTWLPSTYPPRTKDTPRPCPIFTIRKVQWMIGRGFRIEVPTWSEAWPDGSDVKASKWQRDILEETPEDWRGKIGTGLDCSTGGSAYSILNCRSTFRCLSL